MLEALDLDLALGKSEYKRLLPQLQYRLLALQRTCWEARLGSLIVFEGWDAAGKGTAIRKLTQRLEPRGFSLHAVQEPRTSERHLPWMWRFWLKVPNWGEMAIFDRSWYGRVLVERVEGLVEERLWSQAYQDIVSFERGLAEDRYVIVKFFLHIDQQEQRRRFDRLAADPSTAWQVEPEDWEHHRRYDDYVVAIEQMLSRTESEWAPWCLVEATDRRWTRLKIFETLIARLEEGMRLRGIEIPEPAGPLDDEDDEDGDAGDAAADAGGDPGGD